MDWVILGVGMAGVVGVLGAGAGVVARACRANRQYREEVRRAAVDSAAAHARRLREEREKYIDTVLREVMQYGSAAFECGDIRLMPTTGQYMVRGELGHSTVVKRDGLRAKIDEMLPEIDR
jgi:hypothetical protein